MNSPRLEGHSQHASLIEIATKIINTAEQSLREHVITDNTNWDALITHSSTASEMYAKSLKAHSRSLIYVIKLRGLFSQCCDRGDEYPFKFGPFSTNGLESAALFACEFATLELYKSYPTHASILNCCPENSKITQTIRLIQNTSRITRCRDADKCIEAALQTAVMSRKECLCHVADLATRLYQLSLSFKDPCPGLLISSQLKSDVMNAYAHGKFDTYVGKLIKQKTEMQIEIEEAKSKPTPTSDIWACVLCAARILQINPDACLVH